MSWFACPLQQHPGGPAQLCPGSSRGSPAYLQQSPLPLLFHWPSWGHCWSCSWRFLLVFCIASLCSLREMAKTAFYCFSTFGKNKYQRERDRQRDGGPRNPHAINVLFSSGKPGDKEAVTQSLQTLWTGWQSCGTILTIAQAVDSQPSQAQLSQSPANGEVLPWRPPFNSGVLCLSLQHSFFPPSTQTGFPFITLIWHKSASLPKLHAGETESNSILSFLSSEQHRPFSLGSDD